MIGDMHKNWAAGCAALGLVVALAGCGGGDSNSAPSTSKEPAIKSDGLYTSIDQLRAAVREAGIQCPDSIWKPEPTSEIGVGEGKCGNTLRLVVTPEDDLERAQAESSMSREIVKEAYRHIGDSSYTAPHLVTGSRWAAIAAPSASKVLVEKLYGSDKSEEAASDTSAP